MKEQNYTLVCVGTVASNAVNNYGRNQHDEKLLPFYRNGKNLYNISVNNKKKSCKE